VKGHPVEEWKATQFRDISLTAEDEYELFHDFDAK
jgi:hypothetical protein